VLWTHCQLNPDRTRKQLLMLLHRVPWPLDRGDRIRAYHILERLSKSCDVSVACVSDTPVTDEQKDALTRLTVRAAIRTISPKVGKLRGIGSLLAGGAVTPAYFYRSDLAALTRDWYFQRPFDAMITYCTSMVRYSRGLNAFVERCYPHRRPMRHLIDLVDVDSVKWADYAAEARGPMRWVYGNESKQLRRIESGRHDRYDAVAVVSDAEAAMYRTFVGEHPGLTALRHATNTDFFQPLRDSGKQEFAFIGTLNYRPNVEGVVWFANEVMPRVRERVGDATIRIVGRDPSPAVTALDALPGVEVVGSVPDVRPAMEDASVIVAPLLRARGVQSKVLEAMATAKPVVCSPAAAEGICATPNEHLIVAEKPEQWATALVDLLENCQRRTTLGAAARRQVEDHYRWSSCLDPLYRMIFNEDEPGWQKRRDLRHAA